MLCTYIIHLHPVAQLSEFLNTLIKHMAKELCISYFVAAPYHQNYGVATCYYLFINSVYTQAFKLFRTYAQEPYTSVF